MKIIKEVHITRPQVRRLHDFVLVLLSKLTYGFSTTTNKILAGFLAHSDKMNLVLVWKCKGSKIAKNNHAKAEDSTKICTSLLPKFHQSYSRQDSLVMT